MGPAGGKYGGRGVFRFMWLCAAALVASGCEKGTFRETLPAYRYRLTAQVETPEGVKTGSSVIEVQWTLPGKISGTQGGASYRWTGEAVAVDLPKGETLFILLRAPSEQDWGANAAGRAGLLKESVSATGADRRIRPVPRTIKLLNDTVDNYPYFVRFRDTRDSASVEQVDPDDLAKAFGSGTRLKSLTLQITDDPVTRGIERRLPWLSGYPEPSLKPGHGQDDWSIPAVLTHGAFQRTAGLRPD